MPAERDTWDVTADEDDELEENIYETARETILFCIDASESMQSSSTGMKKSTRKSNLHMALECAADLQKRLVLFNPSTSVGILLYNTEERFDGDGGETQVKEHHQLVQTIKQINAPQIQGLLTILAEAEEDPEFLIKKYEPAKTHVPMATVFSCCTGIFRQGAPKTSVKRVFLITDNDEPPNNPHDISVAGRTYLDLIDFGAAMVPFFISSNKDHPFDITQFYSQVFTDLYASDNLEPVPDPVAGFEELREEMRIRESVKRALFSIPLHFGEGLSIGVKGYGLVTEMKKGAYKKFANTGQKMEDVIGVTTYVDPEQQIEVKKEDIVFGFKDTATSQEGGPSKMPRRQPVMFTPAQVKEFKTLGIEPGITILGFKDRSTLRFEHNLRHAYFIYPDEKSYLGSTRAFNALLKACLNKRKVALVRFLPRRSSGPSFAVLLPQAERVVENSQLAPPGFHAIPLPFTDDIRDPKIPPLTGASEDTTEAACKIIEKLTLKGQGYIPDTYLNPALGLHYGHLQATAFNEEFDPEDFVDTTLPNYEMIKTRAGHQMAAWKELLADDEDANEPVAVPKASTTSTKRKAENSMDEVHVRDYYNDGKINKLTVAQLKAFCKAKALPVTGVKAELLERAEGWLASHD